MSCTGPECEHEAWAAGLCFGHYRQRRLGRALRTLRARGQTPGERLSVAALTYANALELQEAAAEYERAETDRAYERAWDRLRKAALAYQEALRSAA